MSDQCPSDDRLIVALDLPDAVAGLEMVERIGEAVSFYKVGLGMLTGGGMGLAIELKEQHGKRIFLDMKLFDISATIESAVRGISRFGLDFLTVHGDPHVVRAARIGAENSNLQILAVTILTSLERADLDECLLRDGSVPNLVIDRAARALAAGAHGVISSPQEAAAIRALPEAAGKLIVTPGIRPSAVTGDDQKRIATPAQAARDGVDHIVVGRPIWRAPDPAAAARAVLDELTAPR